MLGVAGVRLEPLGVADYADEHTRYRAFRFVVTWDGPIRWTVWLGSTVNGRCHLAASLNVWNRDDSYGGPASDPNHWPKNLYYLDSALKDHTPAEGETVRLTWRPEDMSVRGVA